ncbi:FUSC family protein [uncultured Psychrobacter sp.]|uniref:FUSC family protein n=1 Tax=uncultured Psychrobacter sp. TaxID=259303 RepID=UPI002620B5BD|nr:FUSC family protein [uncultured Psychrobacter sp.]
MSVKYSRHVYYRLLQRLWVTIKRLISGEVEHLMAVNQSRRPWHMPLIAAIAISFPVFVGAYFEALSAGIKASLGAMIILNLPFGGSLPQRMVTVMAWGFAIALSFALGLIAQQLAFIKIPIFVLVAFAIVFFGRYYNQPPPAGLFVMMSTAIALFIPVPLTQIVAATGLMVLGSGFALIMALLYSLFLLATRKRTNLPAQSYQPETISESIMVASFVSLSLSIALVLAMPYPYWAAVSCFIIIQGIHLRTMWIKQFHRLLGTLIGIGVAAWMMSWQLTLWQVAAAILMLMLCIESLVDRHYGLAVIFITPLTVLIAEYGSGLPPSQQLYQEVIQARMLDTALGCIIGLIGGMTMQSAKLRAPLHRLERWLLARFGV